MLTRANDENAASRKQRPSDKRELGFLPGVDTTEAFFEPLPESELAAWEGDSLTAEIDAAIALIRADPAAAAAMDREQAEWSEYAIRRLHELTADDEW